MTLAWRSSSSPDCASSWQRTKPPKSAIFNAPMLMDDRGLDSSRDALADHHKMDKIVADLQPPDHAGSAWMANVRKLSEELHGHLYEEEKVFFQLAGKTLDELAKSTLATKYCKDHQRRADKYLRQGLGPAPPRLLRPCHADMTSKVGSRARAGSALRDTAVFEQVFSDTCCSHRMTNPAPATCGMHKQLAGSST